MSSEESLSEASSELDDVPLFLTTSSSTMAAKMPGLQLPSDGSMTARGGHPQMGKLLLGSLPRATDSAEPVMSQRTRGSSTYGNANVQGSPTGVPRLHGGEDHLTDRARQADSSFLSSRPQSQHQDGAPMPTSQPRAAIPSLALGGLRAPAEGFALPHASTSEHPVNSSSWGPAQEVAVSLLSYAFVTSTPTSHSENPTTSGSIPALHDSIAQRVSSQLGVRSQDVRLFELKEIEGPSSSGQQQQQQPPLQQHHVAALVSHSGFSLAALEEMLAWNQQLQSMQAAHSQTISTMHIDYKEAMADNKRLAVQCATKDEELRRMQELGRKMDAEAEALRLALQQGEEQRQQLVSVISMLKQEFLSLRSVIGGEAEQQ